MKVLIVVLIGIGICGAAYGLWWITRWTFRKLGIMAGPYGDDEGMYAALLLALLGTITLIAFVVVYGGGHRASCGPGTKEVVERIWTGKVYVTDYVCVVDMDAVQR